MKIKYYKAKTCIDGYKIAPALRDKLLVAIPESKLPSPSQVLIIYIASLSGQMFLYHSDIPKMSASIPFRDKWSRGLYYLCYFEVNLNLQQLTFNFEGVKNV